MARAQADPDDLRRYARDLRQVQDDVRDLVRLLDQRMDALDWDDDVRRRVADDVQGVGKGLVQFINRLDDYAKQVDIKAADLEKYLG